LAQPGFAQNVRTPAALPYDLEAFAG
jgi:hypothetical protein